MAIISNILEWHKYKLGISSGKNIDSDNLTDITSISKVKKGWNPFYKSYAMSNPLTSLYL